MNTLPFFDRTTSTNTAIAAGHYETLRTRFLTVVLVSVGAFGCADDDGSEPAEPQCPFERCITVAEAWTQAEAMATQTNTQTSTSTETSTDTGTGTGTGGLPDSCPSLEVGGFCMDLKGSPQPLDGMCCYDSWNSTPCCGRPFLVAGRERRAPTVERGEWSLDFPPAVELDAGARAALRTAWAEDASMEHASVAAFARFTLQLLALGAPADLVAASQRASLDEIEHARACYALAGRYGAAPCGPAALPLGDLRLETSIEEVVATAFVEGCIGETVAAAFAYEALAGATDPSVREVLARIEDEEARHAELAWKFVAWACRIEPARAGRAVRAAWERELRSRGSSRGAAGDTKADPSSWRAHGRLTGAERDQIRSLVLDEVVGPCVASLGKSIGDGAAFDHASSGVGRPLG